MPIKQIQLRGISRTPSDRMTADGGLAESINVHLDETETAPTLPPVDVTEKLLGRKLITGIIVHEHKTEDYTNYIELDEGSLYAYINKNRYHIGSIGNEIFTVAKSLGNTLLVVTNEQLHAFLFKDGSYSDATVPQPQIEFRVYNPKVSYENYTSINTWYEDGEYSPILRLEEKYWKACANASQDGRSKPSLGVNDPYYRKAEQLENEFISVQDSILDAIHSNGPSNGAILWFPFLVRYAVRLYDGQYVNVSPPIFIGAGRKNSYRVECYYNSSEGSMTARLYPENVFSCSAILHQWDDSMWNDLIESIDIFVSTFIPHPAIGTQIAGIKYHNGDMFGKRVVFWGDGDKDEAKTIEDAIVNASTFYKIASFSKDELNKLQTEGGYNLARSIPTSQDVLVLQEELGEENLNWIPSSISIYNNRVIGKGGRSKLPSGYSFFMAPVCGEDFKGKEPLNPDNSFRIKYYVRNSKTGATYTVMGRNQDGGYDIPAYSLSELTEGGTEDIYHSRPYGVLFYPDRRCYKVEIDSPRGTISFPMKQHPFLNCSYLYLGVENDLFDYAGGEAMDTKENPFIPEPNRLMMTRANNPFTYEWGNVIDFTDRIVDVAVQTRALSQGQFGQYQVYVFTEGGIFALAIARDGSFSSDPQPVSLDVALPGTVSHIDQAIVFATNKAIMLISGSDISNLSPDMNGRHYILDESVYELLANSPWGKVAEAANRNARIPFMSFIKNCKCLYDYNGERLVFFNNGEAYCYTYHFRSGTWHKISTNYDSHYLLDISPGGYVSSKKSCNGRGIYKITISDSRSDPEGTARVLRDWGVFDELEDASVFLNQTERSVIAELDSQSVRGLGVGLHSLDHCEYRITEYSGESTTSIEDYGTVLDEESVLSDAANPVRGLIVTRPFDLGEPDVRKAIKQVRIRGRFNRNDVMYALMGSFDGIHWQRLRSLRGGSYKLFRMVIVANLSPTERISWIDIDYESRFNNKLR